jgi:hypothetical protein
MAPIAPASSRCRTTAADRHAALDAVRPLHDFIKQIHQDAAFTLMLSGVDHALQARKRRHEIGKAAFERVLHSNAGLKIASRCAVDLTHAPRADPGGDLIRTKAGTTCQNHGNGAIIGDTARACSVTLGATPYSCAPPVSDNTSGAAESGVDGT